MQRLILIAATILVLSGVNLIGQEDQEGKVVVVDRVKRFLCPKYGFSIPVPSHWFVGVTGSGPFYANFTAKRSVRGGELPKGGATINVVAQVDLPSRNGRETLSEWADTDSDFAVLETKQEDVTALPKETGIERAIWISFQRKRYGPDDQAQRQVGIYWMFHERLYVTYLLYVDGDPRALVYKALLDSLMRGIRPIAER